MKNWKAITTVLVVAVIVLCSITLASRLHKEAPGDSNSLVRLFSSANREIVTIPRGTTIHVRLEDPISSVTNSSGDRFSASLDRPLQRGSKVLAPSRAKITGHLVNVKETGRAGLTMVLQTLTVNGKDYNLEARPLTLVDRNTAAGEARSFSGRTWTDTNRTLNSDTGSILASSSAPVAYGPESRFAFTLSRELELPVYRK